MRNIFDQYGGPENRLTHALGCCLDQDRQLLRKFVRWVAPHRRLPLHALKIVEQQVPGAQVEAHPEGDSSLPDLWIHDDRAWSLIIECKVMAKVELGQLERHIRMAKRNGFTAIDVLAIAPTLPPRRSNGVIYRTWPEVYSWSRKHSNNEWARRLTDYMEAAEARMAADEYLIEGTLTAFDGVPFSEDHPYTYREGRRVLKLAMDELRRHRALIKLIDPLSPGRPAITGSRDHAVWDFLRLRESARSKNFTASPHLTLSIQDRRIVVITSLPNAAPSRMRENLTFGTFEDFRDLVCEVEEGVSKAIDNLSGAFPFLEAVQKHYKTQRSTPVDDARLEIDLRTAARNRSSSVKIQQEWLQAAFDALKGKRSHLQIGIGAILRYDSPRIGSREVLDVIAEVWLACRPWIGALLRGR